MNGSSEQPTRQPLKYSQNLNERIEKQWQLQALITQSFDIFQVYGKEPEAVKNILHGFSLVLDPYNGQDITAAFHTWMRTASVMPTAADILGLVKELLAHRREISGDRARPAREYQPDRPAWIYELNRGHLAEPTRQAFRKFLSEFDEQVGRAYCGTLCDYDRIMAA